MKKASLAFAFLAATMLAQAPDNTKVNKRDEGREAVTPAKQSNSKADLEVTRNIRREITKQDGMSTYGKNVKIITRDGVTTLRGPVRSAEEKETIEAIAKRAAGDGKVLSELEVVPAKK